MNIVKEVAKQSFRDLLSKNPEVRVKDLEAEVINLIWYLSLRQTNQINWTLPFLSENLIAQIIEQNLDVMEGVTQMAMEGFENSYNEGNAFVAMQGIVMNMKSMSINDSSYFLKDYFNEKH